MVFYFFITVDHFDYPDNIEDFHNDMPKIAFNIDDLDSRVLDEEIWQMKNHGVDITDNQGGILILYNSKLILTMHIVFKKICAELLNVPILMLRRLSGPLN